MYVYIYIKTVKIPYEWWYDQPPMDNSDLELRACCMLKVQMKQGAPWLRRLTC